MANTKITNPELFNLGDSTSATQLPVMTNTQRIAMNAIPITPFNIDYLVVAGGGGSGGASHFNGGSGGGGAGGLLTNVGGASLVLTTGGSGYTVTVGDGGAGGTTGGAAQSFKGNSGSDSAFGSITATGGGYGGAGDDSAAERDGGDGGSGGGAGARQIAGTGGSATLSSTQGNNGGDSFGNPQSARNGGGGGGAGSAGTNATSSSGGAGGSGLSNNITGFSITYAQGGLSPTSVPTNSVAGSDNTGDGARGAKAPPSATDLTGAKGGSGVVILRYPTADIASYTATGLTPTETIVGTDTVLSFTTVGTGTITFTSSTPTGTISTGEMIFNSTTDKVEYFDGTKWYGITSYIPANTNIFNDNSCIAYYRFNGNADDETGNYNATASNETYSATGGKEGGYISLPQNSSGTINTNDSGVLAPGGTNVRSYSIWVQFQETGQYDTIWSQWRSSPTPRRTSFYIRKNNVGQIQVVNYLSNSSSAYYTTTTNSAFTALNSWYNIVVSIGQSNIVTIWVNGTLMNNTTGSGTVGTIYSTTDPNTIIGSLANASTGTYGIFDEARVFNRALTNAEALILWNEF